MYTVVSFIAIVFTFVAPFFIVKKFAGNSNFIVKIIVYLLFMGICSGIGSFISRAFMTDDDIKEEQAQQKQEQLDQARQDSINWETSEKYSAIKFAGEWFVKENLRNPDSYEYLGAKYDSINPTTYVSYIKYRAQNGFGGMNVEVTAVIVKVNNKTHEAVPTGLYMNKH